MTSMVLWGSSSLGIGTALQAELSPLGVTINNEGKGSEFATGTAARMGSVPARLTFANDTIPASGSALVTADGIEDMGAPYVKPFHGTVSGAPM
ncbi:hypothetical protein ACX5K5_06115 [Glutamicibacter bergerei]